MCCCMKDDTNLVAAVGVAMSVTDGVTVKRTRKSRETIKREWQRNPAFGYVPPAPVRDMREQVWDLLRTGKQYSVQDIVVKLSFTVKQVEYLLKGWVKTGYVQKQRGIWKVSTPTFVLIKDVGQEPPRINKNGEPVPTPLNELVWRAMRIQKTFNARQIMAVCAKAEQLGAITTYLRMLSLAGYLQPISALAGEYTTYRLVEDTGAKPPQILKRKSVYDANLGIVVYDPTKKTEK